MKSPFRMQNNASSGAEDILLRNKDFAQGNGVIFETKIKSRVWVDTAGYTAAIMPTGTVAKAASKKSAGTSAKQHDPRVTAKVQEAPEFARPILEYLRAAVHEAVPEVTEDIKWGRPFFLLDGELLGNMAAFSRHCAFGFWSAKMSNLLAADGIDGSGSSGSLGKITAIEDLPPRKVLLGYLATAARMMREGTYGPGLTAAGTGKSVRAPLPMPAEFAAALSRSKAASANFEGFPPSCRREYIEWITTAKRSETRERRITEAVFRIAEGKRHNEQYRSN